MEWSQPYKDPEYTHRHLVTLSGIEPSSPKFYPGLLSPIGSKVKQKLTRNDQISWTFKLLSRSISVLYHPPFFFECLQKSQVFTTFLFLYSSKMLQASISCWALSRCSLNRHRKAHVPTTVKLLELSFKLYSLSQLPFQAWPFLCNWQNH